MPPTLQAMMEGDPPAVVSLRLSISPLIEPYGLVDLEEPTWPDYAPANFQFAQRSGGADGWGWMEGYGSFTYRGDVPSAPITGIWILANYQFVDYLLYVLDMAGRDDATLLPGVNSYNVRINAYLMPQE